MKDETIERILLMVKDDHVLEVREILKNVLPEADRGAERTRQLFSGAWS